MNTTFENELRKVFDKVPNLENKKYVGRAFYAGIDKDIKLKAEFISTETHDKFDAMKIRVLYKGEGELDTNTIRLKEIWGMKPVRNGNFPNGVSPHMWIYNGRLEWYAYTPNTADYVKLAEQITDYAEVFQDEDMHMEMSGMSM